MEDQEGPSVSASEAEVSAAQGQTPFEACLSLFRSVECFSES